MKKYLSVILSCLAIGLELLPFGAVLRFAGNGAVETIVRGYSYFDLVPYGYANFGPLLTAVLSVILLILSLIYAFAGKCLKGILSVGAIALLTSVLPLIMFGIGYYNIIALAISLLIAVICINAYLLMRNNK